MRWSSWGSSKRKAIYSVWEQSWKMMDAVQRKSLNCNEAATVEYLAPPLVNQEEQATIKNIIDTFVTIRGGSNLNPLKWWLHVRYDDPDGKCPCNPGSDLYQVVKDKSNKELPIEHRANLNNYYKNKGRVWFHELLHIDWASGVDSPYHITDLICMLSDQDGEPFTLPIYGPQLTKGLIKFKLGAAWWLKRNADNFAMYAMAKTVQKATGNYPHIPLAVTLKGVQDSADLFMTGNIIIDREGRTTIVGPKDQGECQAPDDEDGPGGKDNVVPFNSSTWFMDESYYPEDYNRQGSGWLADANPRHNRVRVVLMQTAAGPQWIVVEDTPEDPIKDFCLTEILSKVPANGDENNLEFPTELPAFEAHGAKGHAVWSAPH
ncbi:glycoside hydrolase family 18 [Fusarium denticulatum]|uniref:Glycoside hydrolase family 18 n=1 Tax=Fusarium denticulatum TaxID=48507 RepID=A0A8H5WZD1_9HYPO|nr:glycoside hydrolase family 18 [Fusarium denticulatum]